MPIRFRRLVAVAVLCAPVSGLSVLAGCAGAPVAYTPAGAPVAASVPAPYGAPYAAPYATSYGAPVVAASTGYMCFAGTYQCQLAAQVPVGSSCSCPGIGAPSYGIVR